MKLNIAFRVDASVEIGIGHLMRCLTLADELKNKGAYTRFISRHLPDYLYQLLVRSKHDVSLLTLEEECDTETLLPKLELSHAKWLGTSQVFDAKESSNALKDKMWDWIVVDHYAIDQHWENLMRDYTNKVMVIDDLADRQHDCDLLLDQTLGRTSENYNLLTPKECSLFIGPNYSLLRGEFSKKRAYSIKRRSELLCKNILITMGGTDKNDAISIILNEIKKTTLAQDSCLTIILGSQSPALKKVKKLAATMPWNTKVLVDVNNMAELMSESDLCIGAAGSTSWERCCLGLPSLLVILEDNQNDISNALELAGASINLGRLSNPLFRDNLRENINKICTHKSLLKSMIKESSLITIGTGTLTIAEAMSGT